MIFEHKLSKMVEFSHTDMAGIMHFSNFYRFMEAVEHDLFRLIGHSIAGEYDENGVPVGWPRVQSECSHSAPLKFEDIVELHLVIREIRNATLKYEVIFSKLVEGERIEAARGSVTIVHVGFNPATKKMLARPLPDWIKSQLTVAPENYLIKKLKKS